MKRSPHPPARVNVHGVTLAYRRSNARGVPMGISHWNVRHGDEVVAQAKELKAQGLTHRAIAAHVDASVHAVISWCLGRRRRPHARVIVQRVKARP